MGTESLPNARGGVSQLRRGYSAQRPPPSLQNGGEQINFSPHYDRRSSPRHELGIDRGKMRRLLFLNEQYYLEDGMTGLICTLARF